MAQTHTQPWIQMILYDYKLGQARDNFYEEKQIDADNWMFRIASKPGRVRFLILFDSDGIIPPP
jgi:hypothetical protein